METISLIYSILGAPRGCVLPFAYAVDLTADCLFKQHMSMEKFKLSDVCRQVAERLPYQLNPRSVESEVGRWANRCLKKIVKEGWTEEYLGKQLSDLGGPRMIVIYLATFAHFEKPFYEMIIQHPEVFIGQAAVDISMQQEGCE